MTPIDKHKLRQLTISKEQIKLLITALLFHTDDVMRQPTLTVRTRFQKATVAWNLVEALLKLKETYYEPPSRGDNQGSKSHNIPCGT